MQSSVALIIPAYNAAGSIATAVAAARRVPGSTVIVVDDGSSDATAETARRAGATVFSQKNMGASKARSEGLRHVTQDYVVFADADDVLNAGAVAEAVCLLDRSPECVGAVGLTRFVVRGMREHRVYPHWREGLSLQAVIDRGQPPGPPASMVWRRSALRSAEGAEPPMIRPRYAEDYELCIRMLAQGPMITFDMEMCDYNASGGKSSMDPMSSIQDAERLRRYYAAAYGIKTRYFTARTLLARRLRRYSLDQALIDRTFISKIFWISSLIVGPELAISALRRRFKSRDQNRP